MNFSVSSVEDHPTLILFSMARVHVVHMHDLCYVDCGSGGGGIAFQVVIVASFNTIGFFTKPR